jgi:ubiquinone biosynthesis protein UbiJ
MTKTYKKWNQTDIQFILDHQEMLDKDIAAKLTEITGQIVSQSMVRRQRRKSGIAKKRGRPRKNTEATTNN